MAKINVYKVIDPPRVSSGASANIKYVGASLNANTKALNGLGLTLSGIAATSNGLSGVADASLKESKLREIRDRRAAQRERDRLREEQRESSVIKGPEKVKEQPKPTGKVKSWMEKVFGGLFGWLAPLAKAALTFFGALFAMKAAKDLQRALQDPSVREKFTKFFEKVAFVAKKIFAIGSWLIKDNLLEGFNNTFGENKTVEERLKGLGQMMIGIIGLRTLLNPFGTMMQIMSLMNLRSREMNAADRRLRLREQRLAADNARLKRQAGRRPQPDPKAKRTKPTSKPKPGDLVRDKTKPSSQTAVSADAARIGSNQTGSNVVRRSDAAGNRIAVEGRRYRAQLQRSGSAPTFQQRPGGLSRSTLPTSSPFSVFNRSENARVGRLNQSFARSLVGQAGPIDNLRLLRRGFIKQNRFQTVTSNLARSGARGLFRAPGNIVRGVVQTPRAIRTGVSKLAAPLRPIGQGIKATAQGLSSSIPLLKNLFSGGSAFFKRIPWLGVILTGLLEVFDIVPEKVDPATGEQISPATLKFDKSKLGKALFSMAGTAVGGAVGSLLGPLGTIGGSMLGQYAGDLLYRLFMGESFESVGEKFAMDVKDSWKRASDITGAIFSWAWDNIKEIGGNIADWANNKFSRLYESLKKFKLQDFVHSTFRAVLAGFGKIAEFEIPDPRQFIVGTQEFIGMTQRAVTALFSEKPIKYPGGKTMPDKALPVNNLEGISDVAQDALGGDDATIVEGKTLASQITKNYGYKLGQSFYFHHAGKRYRAKREPDGWHIYGNNWLDYVEKDTKNGKNPWLLNAFVSAIEHNAELGRSQEKSESEFFAVTELEDAKPITEPGFDLAEASNATKVAYSQIASRFITNMSGAYYRKHDDGRFLGNTQDEAIKNMLVLLRYGSGASKRFRNLVFSSDTRPAEQSVPAPDVPNAGDFPVGPVGSGYDSAQLVGGKAAAERVGNDKEFLAEVKRVSQKFGIREGDLLGIMASESGLNPAESNGTNVGLIQFSKDSAAAVGTTQDALVKMTRAQQMKYVERYFQYWKDAGYFPDNPSAGQLYAVIFSPAYSGRGLDEALYSAGESGYDGNAPLDVNKDGIITIREMAARVDKKKIEFGIGDTGLTPGPRPASDGPAQGSIDAVLDVPPEMSQDLKNVTASHGPLLGGPTRDAEFKAGKGDKSRRIFLHWTGGFSNQPSTRYHTTFTGDGKANRNTENYGIDLGDHTGGANTNSVGLSLAAMGHRGMTANYYDENKGWAENPPTGAQIQAMALEAARLAHAWGWNASTIQSNVRTHGEWERYGTSAGILSGRPQRWDLDQLRPGQPFDQTETISNGGNEMRALITAYFNKIKAAEAQGADQLGQVRQSSPTPTPILQLPEGVVLTSDYGAMRGSKMHGGTDIAAPAGTDLVAPTDGTIVDYGSLNETGAKRGDPNGWGNFIVFKDKNGLYHLYGHILDGFSKSGTLKEGQKIADVGNTGKSSGPHLHWELGTNWTGGVLEGKSDPLKTYRLETPFIGQNMRGATLNQPTGQVPGPQLEQRQASIMDGVLVVPPSLAGDNVPIDDAVIPKLIQGLTEGTLKAFQAPVGSASGILNMFKSGASAIQRGLQPLYGKTGEVIGYARGKAGDAANAVSDAAGDLFRGADNNFFGNNNPYGIQKQTDSFGNPLDPYAFARRQAPMELPLIETYNTLSKQWDEVLGPQKIDIDDVKNSYFGGRNLSIDQGLQIFQMQLQDAFEPKSKTFTGPEGNDIEFPALQPLPPLSDGGSVTPLPNNLEGFFLGKVFKSIGKAISNAFNSVKKAVVSITSNPIFKLVTTAVSIFVPPLAPVIAGINAVSSLMQGDIIGAVVGGFGALGGAFPGTFGAEGTFFSGLNKTFGDGLGGVFKGFLTGGIGGAIGGIGQALAPGLKNLLGGLGGFMDKNPQIGKMFGSLVNMTGMQGLLGPALEGAGVSPTGAVTQQADAAGGLISAVLKMGLGMATKALGLEQAAGAIGVNPAAFGIAPPASRLLNTQDQVMQQMAQFGPIEVTHVPVIVEKLVAIKEPVPIIQTQVKYKPAPPKQQ